MPPTHSKKSIGAAQGNSAEPRWRNSSPMLCLQTREAGRRDCVWCPTGTTHTRPPPSQYIRPRSASGAKPARGAPLSTACHIYIERQSSRPAGRKACGRAGCAHPTRPQGQRPVGPRARRQSMATAPRPRANTAGPKRRSSAAIRVESNTHSVAAVSCQCDARKGIASQTPARLREADVWLHGASARLRMRAARAIARMRAANNESRVTGFAARSRQ